MFEQALRCPQLAEAVREMEESLETVTPEVLQKRENESWSARVGDRCEGRYMAGASSRIPTVQQCQISPTKFVPETKRSIDELLKFMKQKRQCAPKM